MDAILTFLGKLVRNKWFWIILATIIALLVVRKYWGTISGWFKPDRADYSQDPPLTDEDKRYLEDVAQRVYAEIDGLTVTHPLTIALIRLNNRQLKYLAQVFPHYSGGESLKDAIDNEWIEGGADQELVARLNNMAM